MRAFSGLNSSELRSTVSLATFPLRNSCRRTAKLKRPLFDGAELGVTLVRSAVGLVLPTYNEVQNLPRLLPLIFGEAEKISTHELYVLVVDDNSPDGSAEYVRSVMGLYPRLRLLTRERNGLGEAYKHGIAHAIETLNPDLILQMDADFQHDPAKLPEIIGLCAEKYDLVIGSRFVAGTRIAGLSWPRKLISRAGTRLVWTFGKIPHIQDCTSGFRCIRTELIAKCEFEPSSTAWIFFSVVVFVRDAASWRALSGSSHRVSAAGQWIFEAYGAR